MNPFVCDGVCQFQIFGVQVQTVGWMPVEYVAENGTAQAVRMGAMHPQLVGTSCVWIETDAIYSDYFIVGDSWFAMFVVNYLSWTIDGVAE